MRLVLRGSSTPSRITDPAPPPLQEGDRLDLWISRLNGSVRQEAVVKRVSDHAYWLFELDHPVDPDALGAAVKEFETSIWPKVTGVFGPPWTPGVDSDPRILIMHTRVSPGVAGYFSGADSYPSSIMKYSNQREIIYISSTGPAPGTFSYHATLAHELQHASHWNADQDEDTWLNEGMSEVASIVAGYRAASVSEYLRSPTVSLTEWAENISRAGPNYGAATLFLEYLMAHYGGDEALRKVVASPLDGLESVTDYLEDAGYGVTGLDVFRDWLVATYLDEPDGIYTYPNRDLRSGVRLRSDFVLTPGTIGDSVPPMSGKYYAVAVGGPSVRLAFTGDPVAQLLPVPPRSGETCWWGNAGDAIDSKLTRTIDLTSLPPGSPASFEYSVWADIEEDWDYAYLQVSTDGSKWTMLPTRLSRDADPNGSNYGQGMTGRTTSLAGVDVHGWIRESIDLSAYSGLSVQVRFEYITDDAVHGRGLCLDDFAVPQLGWSDDTETSGDWEAAGFARVSNEIPQDYVLQVVRQPQSGQATVIQVPVAGDGTAETTVSDLTQDERLTVIISPVTAGVAGGARFALEVQRVE